MIEPSKPLRVLVCGSRDWKDGLYERGIILDALHSVRSRHGIEVVIHGDCNGVDRLAKDVAYTIGIPTVAYPADWKTHGKAAGPIRNAMMLKEGKPDLVLAFTHDLQASRGTRDMVNKARAAGVRVVVLPHV